MTHEEITRILFRNRMQLMAYVWSIVADVHRAEDVVQELMVLAINKSDEIKNERHLMAWIRRAARYEALNVYRRERRRSPLMDAATLDLLETTWQDVSSVNDEDRISALRHYIKKLTPYLRRVVELRYVDDLKGQVLADKVGRGVETTYKALGRAHHLLRECVTAQIAIAEGRING